MKMQGTTAAFWFRCPHCRKPFERVVGVIVRGSTTCVYCNKRFTRRKARILQGWQINHAQQEVAAMRKEKKRKRRTHAFRNGSICTREWLKSQPPRWRTRLMYHYSRCADGNMDGEFLDSLEAAQGDRCFYCEGPMGKNMVIEHVQPIARGGTNDQSNIVLACWDCNDRKYVKTAEEFMRAVH